MSSELILAKKLFDEALDADEAVLLERWQEHIDNAALVRKGGPGSGNFGHAGRPGKVGGSSSGVNTGYEYTRDGSTGSTLITNYKGIRVIAARDGSEDTANTNMAKLDSILSTLPADHIAGIQRIDMNVGDFPLGNMAYIDGMRDIWIASPASSLSSDRYKQALIHEVGHHVQLSANTGLFNEFKQAGYGSTSNFHNLAKGSGWAAESLKNYAQDRHAGEAFAESYSIYHTNPSRLRTELPDVYEFFKGKR